MLYIGTFLKFLIVQQNFFKYNTYPVRRANKSQKGGIRVAGKELKATEKTVLKHSRDGVLEQNLADGSAKKVSKKAEEAILKTEGVADERFDKLKAAGLVVEDVKKPDHRKLQFGRNNPDNTWAEAVYGNKPTEQLSFIPDEKYQNSETSIPVIAEEFAEMRQTPFKAEELKDFDFSKTRLKHSFCSDDEYTTSETVLGLDDEKTTLIERLLNDNRNSTELFHHIMQSNRSRIDDDVRDKYRAIRDFKEKTGEDLRTYKQTAEGFVNANGQNALDVYKEALKSTDSVPAQFKGVVLEMFSDNLKTLMNKNFANIPDLVLQIGFSNGELQDSVFNSSIVKGLNLYA